MLVKVAFLSVALVSAFSQPSIADGTAMVQCRQDNETTEWLITQGQCAPYLQGSETTRRMMIPPPSSGPGDVMNGRGPVLQGRELRQIAIYLAMGNHDAAAIAMSRLQKFGITRDMLRDALDNVKLRRQQGVFPVIPRTANVPFPEYPSRGEASSPRHH